jgi:hypothetical protein
MRYIIYNDKGQILRNISCPPDMIEIQLAENEYYIESEDTVDDSLFYISEEVVVQRPELSIIVEGITVYNLPNPSTLIVEGSLYEVTDGEAELSFSFPGTYTVRIQSFPYKDKTIEVTQE